MSAPDYRVGVGDDQVPIDQVVRDQDGNWLDIDGATVVTFTFAPKNRTSPAATVTGSVVGTSPLTKARAVLSAADLATAGDYDVTWTVVLASGESLTYPARSAADAGSPVPGDRYLWLQVVAQLP